MDKAMKITEKTLIPISLLTIIVGGVFWLTNIYFSTATNASEIKELKQQRKDDTILINEKLDKLIEDVSFIKGKLRQ